jgi:hypothetical protein
MLASATSTVCLASLSVYMAPEDLARRAELVVEGTVQAARSGYDPADGSLATYVTVAVEMLHRGALGGETLVIREPGGHYGDLAHHVDAVPVYRPGERVLLFLEPAADGALRTAGMFYGKFTLTEQGPRGIRIARRELEGQGLIVGRNPGRTESLALSDLLAVVETVPRVGRSPRRARPAPPRASPLPPEFHRLRWESHGETARGPDRERSVAAGEILSLAQRDAAEPPTARFAPMNETDPARWYATDAGQGVTVHVQRSGDPLGDAEAAVAQIERALDAWTEVAESRITLQMVNDDFDYTGKWSNSPTALYTGTNVILFDDPYHDISDPIGCAGVLAIGGYWRESGWGGAVNGVGYHPALQFYVIFNNDFECFLGDPDNLAEVATHELGHGIGFGHSLAPDSIMRSSAYGWHRGPRLGDDDRDAAHCHYPHELSILEPTGGEIWEAGTLQVIRWASTEEQGADAGEVSLEYSTDGGQTWKTIADGVENDGHHEWLVPEDPSADVRVRVARHHRAAYAPQVYSGPCSGAVSPSAVRITAPPPVAGSIPSGSDGVGVSLAPGPNGLLRLSWEPSCSPGAVNHAVYQGSLAALRAGVWDHVPLTCHAGPDLAEYVPPGPGDRYYLVAPLTAETEGSLGAGSSGALRPVSPMPCAPREADSSCD